MKRGHLAAMPKPDAVAAAHDLAMVFEHYDEKHPCGTLKHRSPREFSGFRRSMATYVVLISEALVNARRFALRPEAYPLTDLTRIRSGVGGGRGGTISADSGFNGGRAPEIAERRVSADDLPAPRQSRRTGYVRRPVPGF